MEQSEPSEWWERPLRKPLRLKSGDRVAIVSPCWGGPATFPQRYEAGKRYLAEKFGLEVIESAHALSDAAWLDANPGARANDLMWAFNEPSINGVIASIGGDDAVRLIPYLDLSVIRDNPKVFVGYSDVTALHFACLKAGIATFHGPTVMSGFAENCGMSSLSATTFHRAVFQSEQIGTLPTNTDGWTVEHLDWSDLSNQEKPRRRTVSEGIRKLRGTGRAKGHLIGGCAEVLEMLKGTPWWPPLSYWDGAILFYETSEEAPSETLVLRWLRNFAAQGILHKLNGIILARPGGQMNEAQRTSQKTAVLKALDEAGLHNLPVLADLDFGHTDPIATLPYGALVEMDCETPSLSILQAAVRP